MGRATQGGSRIATKPADKVDGGQAEVNRARFVQHTSKPLPAWVDDPDRTWPCQERGVDPETFHPKSATGQEATKAVAAAVQYCRRCDRRLSCLELGLANGEVGVWGGRFLDPMRATAKAELLAKLRNGRDVR